MAIFGQFFRTDEKTIQEIQQGNVSLADLVYGENRDRQITDVTYNEDDDFLDIDRTWDPITLALFDVDTLSDVTGNKAVNDEDMGYGPAHFCTHEEVRRINEVLIRIDEDDFRTMFTAGVDNEWLDVFDDVYLYFQKIVTFYKKAASQDQAVLFWCV
ncbi:MAG: YfbM family protein [Peptococcaceae bacterium]|nr:YfbM family protein [Peptococcaceae bacterium]